MMAKEKHIYTCSSCGHQTSKWYGRCPNCQEWNTMEEKIIQPAKSVLTSSASFESGRKLKDVRKSDLKRIVTGVDEFDRVMGGGLVPDSLNLIAAPPGCGKSTLAIMVADCMLKNGYNVLYASGEESASQIRARAERLELKYTDEMYIVDNSSLDFVLSEVDKYDIDFIVLDSINTFYLNELLPAKQGNPVQTNGVVSALKDLCKQQDRPRCAFVIDQMTKDNQMAGNRFVEHIVDSCLFLESNEDFGSIRQLYASKNRFGALETGWFEMDESGLHSIPNISQFFLTKRTYGMVGCAVSALRSGNRSIFYEVEALTPQSSTSFPTRISSNFKRDILNVLVAILEQRADIPLGTKNIFVKTSGNIQIKDNSCNLAILVAIASSALQKTVPQNICFFGDCSLSGEIKRVINIESLIREATRIGYSKVVVAKGSKPANAPKGIEIIECDTIKDVLGVLFM